MPRVLTGVRNARSTVRVAAISTVETDELDFELASNQAIEVLAIKHIVGSVNMVIVSAIAFGQAQISLHAETLALEDPLFDADNTVRDSEILDGHVVMMDNGDDSGAAQGGITVQRTKLSGPWENLPSGTFSVTNLTHRVETDGILTTIASTYFIKYRYVELSLSELGVFLALRR